MNALTLVHPAAQAAQAAFHPDIVAEVAAAAASERVLVVGMAWNIPVKQARRALEEKGVPYRYLEYGNYITGWKRRLALKMWAGWPTFPMVFVKGQLVGGASDLKRLIKSGELDQLLA